MFFIVGTATTVIYTLSLHDALPISRGGRWSRRWRRPACRTWSGTTTAGCRPSRSEEHTSELQSLRHLVCRLLLEKKKIYAKYIIQLKLHVSIFPQYKLKK